MKIGILQTGLMAESLSARLGEYPDMFARLLHDRGFTFETYSVVQGDFPSGPDAADGWLVTGSKHGAYEDHDWIAPLEALIRDIHHAGRRLVGVCFGHQIIAQALGGRVVKFDGGWSVGAVEYDYGDRVLTLNAWHQDQVVERPEGAQVVAKSAFCENAALLYGDRIYTVQPHPEFDRAVVDGLISERGPGVVPDALLSDARAGLDTPTHSAELADQFERFFKTGAIR